MHPQMLFCSAQADDELRDSFAKRKCQQIRSPPPRSELVRQLSHRYCKDGGNAVQKASMIITKKHNEFEEKGGDVTGKSSVPLPNQSSPLLPANMEEEKHTKYLSSSIN